MTTSERRVTRPRAVSMARLGPPAALNPLDSPPSPGSNFTTTGTEARRGGIPES